MSVADMTIDRMDTRVGGVASTVEATTDWSRALAWRMDRQFLRNRAGASDIVTVVARLAGLHAQVWSSSVAALAVRTDQVDTAALAAALWSDRSLAKLWAMRGTLHLLPAADHPTWVAGLDMYRHSYATTGCGIPTFSGWLGSSTTRSAGGCSPAPSSHTASGRPAR